MKSLPLLLSAVAFLFVGSSVRASIAYGSFNNFDCVNDTGEECHGFEIELEDCRSIDIGYTYNWNHYGTPHITQDDSIPGHPVCRIRWESAKNPDGSWAAYTAIPTAPIPPTAGHAFTNPAVNFGGEHFGAGCAANVTVVKYHWLLADANGVLVVGPAVDVATPVFNYAPAAAGQPGQVGVFIEDPEAAEAHDKPYGKPNWVKEIRTSSHNARKVKLRDLVSDDPGDPNDVNWRNNEPAEVETEWALLQTQFGAANGGQKGRLAAAPQALPAGNEIVTRRYEFYAYTGTLKPGTGEAFTESVGPDGIHGTGAFEGVEVVGKFLGAQMSAFDPAAGVDLIEHVQDGAVDSPYAARTVVLGGANPFTATLIGALPDGLAFDPVTGILSGQPTTAGEFTFTLTAEDQATPKVARTYTVTIAAAGQALPPHAVVDTVAEPLGGGTTAGDGAYAIGDNASLTATPAAGYAFVNWSDHGAVVSQSPGYTLPVDVNHALVAHFALIHPDRLITADAAPLAGGSVTGAGTYADNAAVTLTAVSAANYNFVNWTENGAIVATTASYSFTASASRTLVANFSLASANLRTLTLTASPAGAGVLTGAGSYATGSAVTIVATAGADYLFDRWTEGNGNTNVSSTATTSLTLTADRSLTARFLPAYTISASTAPASAGATAGGGKFLDKDRVTLVATASPGYIFQNWTENGAVVSTSSSYQFRANPSRTLVANFTLPVPPAAFDRQSDGTATFHWPASYAGWVLEESADLTSGSWTASTRPVQTAAGENRVSVDPKTTPPRRYFRLSHP